MSFHIYVYRAAQTVVDYVCTSQSHSQWRCELESHSEQARADSDMYTSERHAYVDVIAIVHICACARESNSICEARSIELACMRSSQ